MDNWKLKITSTSDYWFHTTQLTSRFNFPFSIDLWVEPMGCWTAYGLAVLALPSRSSWTLVNERRLELNGIEPMTSWMQIRRSSNWAIAPEYEGWRENSGEWNTIQVISLFTIQTSLFKSWLAFVVSEKSIKEQFLIAQWKLLCAINGLPTNQLLG